MSRLGVQIQEAQRIPTIVNPHKTTPRHFIFKMARTNDKHGCKTETKPHKEQHIRFITEFSSKTL